MSGIPCCVNWEAAQQAATDSEQYSSLLGRNVDGDWQLGSYELHPVVFCPWCGAKVASVHPLVTAAEGVIAIHKMDNWGDTKTWAAMASAIGNLATELEKLK
jgi:hypothetical protein